MGDDASIAGKAAAWHAASLGEEMDWDGFSRWLAADDRHRLAYDEVALADDLLARQPALLEQEAASADLLPFKPRRRWPLWAGGALAASLAAVMIVGQLQQPPPRIYSADTAPQQVALADGSSVVLAPHSRLIVAGKGESAMTLEGGAYFDIRHDPSRELAIAAGEVTVTDIGTRFDIRQDASKVQVEVAEGQVTARSSRLQRPLTLAAGRRLVFDPSAGRAQVSQVETSDVGAWREGRLSFDGAPLELVARDLARYASVRVEIAPSLKTLRFSGSLSTGNGDAAVRDLAQVMQLRLRRDGDVLRLEPAD